MSERLDIFLEARDFDRLVHTGLPEGCDMKIALKIGATKAGAPAVCVSFSSLLPDGRAVAVQAVTTLKLLAAAVDAMRARAGWERGEIPP